MSLTYYKKTCYNKMRKGVPVWMTNRYDYINQHKREHYDRIELNVPKGYKEKIKAAAASHNMSVNEYVFMLITTDMEGGGVIPTKKEGLSAEDHKMLDKWQVAMKYREMIEYMDIDEINGMNKHYTIVLKKGFINDETGSRTIKVDKMHEIRRVIKLSHPTNEQ